MTQCHISVWDNSCHRSPQEDEVTVRQRWENSSLSRWICCDFLCIPGLPSGSALSLLTRRPDGLTSQWARACQWSRMELCVRLQRTRTKYPAPLSLTGLWCERKTRQITRDVMSRVKSVLGLRPDTLISTGRGKGCIIFLFQGKDPNTHWELFGYAQACMRPSLLSQTQPVPPGWQP